ncbi:MAG: HDOD domain-containing protein [Thiotrichaceae bacterium]|nr:HDOD domain-containing protein [Thiotrichaceae bacterium]
MDDLDKIIAEIMQRIEKNGDLPVFSASVNRIRQISSSEEATAMSLSKEATKDVNLTAKLLRLANSSYYNRGKGKISVISRAVVILGFNTVKNQCLTMKLIDSFQHEHPSIEMNKMLVNAYLTAGFVREIASKAGLKDVEEAYTCALLHNLGEIVIAYFLPEKFTLMQEMRINHKISQKEIEKEVLGGSIKEVGQILARNWEFPSSIVTTMEPFNPEKESTKSSVQMNKALSSLASSVVKMLRSPDSTSEISLNDLLGTLSKTAALPPSTIENSLMESFKVSCELATEYGLQQETLMPAVEGRILATKNEIESLQISPFLPVMKYQKRRLIHPLFPPLNNLLRQLLAMQHLII